MFKKIAGVLVAVAVPCSAYAVDPTLTIPTPDYTNFMAAAAVGIGIAVVVTLIRKAKGIAK